MISSVARCALTAAMIGALPAAAQQPALLVLNKDEASASLISLADGRTLVQMPVGDFPHEVAVSPDGRWAVVANYGAQAPGHSLTVLDLASRRVSSTIELSAYPRPHGIEWLADGKRLIVTSEQARSVIIVDVFAGKVEREMRTGQAGHMVTLSKDGLRCWTANVASGSVSLIDLERGEVIKTVVTGRRPEANDISPDGREFWVADGQLNRITVLAAGTLDSLASIPTGDSPNRLHFTRDGRSVLVSNIRSGTVSVYDAAKRTQVSEISFPFDSSRARPAAVRADGRTSAPEGILLSPDGKRAWVALSAQNQIAEVEVGTWKILRYISTGQDPDGMGYVKSAGGG